MKKNKMLYRIVAAVLACAVVALALVTYQSRSSSNAPVAEKAVGRHIPRQRHLFARRKKLWAKISILLCGLLLTEI